MENFTKVMASIGSAVIPVGYGLWSVGTFAHKQFVQAQSTSLYRSLESSLASFTGFSQPERITDLGTLAATIGLVYVANEAAKPLVRGFAHLYGAKLE